MSAIDRILSRADAPLGEQQPIARHRLVFFGLSALIALAISLAFAGAVTQWTWVAWAALPLVLVNALWIAGGATTALLGLMQPRLQLRRPAPDWHPTDSTALLVTLCGEQAQPLADYLNQLARDLDRDGLKAKTRIFVLSDTSNQSDIALENKAFRTLIDDGHITYRRRTTNTGKKPGNIADWLNAHGSNFEHMMVLDADSRMSAARVRDMMWQIERKPRTGLIQAGIALVPGRSGFGRHQRKSSRLLSHNFGRGFAAWSGQTGNYWGHNAIMRVEAFRCASKLPQLSGRAPFGGALLSHDFIEAAWMRRAGWNIELDPDLAGSAEDAPQTFDDFFRRDRRWCQGNLQHLRLLAEPGLHPISRLHLASGIFSYLAAPIWLLLVGLIGSGTLSIAGALPLVLVAIALLLPKLCALVAAMARAKTPWRRSVFVRAWISELAMSTLLAPLIMVRQAASVGSVLLGIDCGWKTQHTARLHLPVGTPEALAGVALLVLSATTGGLHAVWLAPILLPMLSAPLIMRALNGQA
ncbi:MAG: glucans biosynthesis glucosyltransferase MdoH [Devosiaceae bacterium]